MSNNYDIWGNKITENIFEVDDVVDFEYEDNILRGVVIKKPSDVVESYTIKCGADGKVYYVDKHRIKKKL